MQITLTSKTAQRKPWLSLLFVFLLPFVGKADLGITPLLTQNGDQITADIMVSGFDDIVAMQFTFQWDHTAMHFEGVGDYGLDGMDAANFGYVFVENGRLTYSWFDPAAVGITLPDCSMIVRLNFTSLGGGASAVTIADSPTAIEIIAGPNDQEIPLVQSASCLASGNISGRIFNDINKNCLKDEGEPGVKNCLVRFQHDGQVNFVSANDDGEYSLNCLPGTYSLTVILPENLFWEACEPTYEIELAANESVVQDFGTSPPDVTSGTGFVQSLNFTATLVRNPVQTGTPVLVETTSAMPRLLQLETYNVVGQLLQSQQWEVPAGVSRQSAGPVDGPGVYFLKMVEEDGKGEVLKVVVRG